MPDKIIITPGYVSEDFEKEVLDLIEDNKTNPITNAINRNRVLRYGSKTPYPDRVISKDIPNIFDTFRNNIVFDSVTINEYYPGQAINWHIDDIRAGPDIFIISLLSDAHLEFRKSKTSEVFKFFVPRFSLTVFSDEIRYKYQHYLKADEKRISIVFRNSKNCIIK